MPQVAHVLIVHESESARAELGRALQAEGLRVTEADSSAAAVREVWSGSFDAAVVSPQLPKVSGTPLEEHIRSLAPEIVTLPFGREPAVRLARRVVELLEGGAAAA
jgi:DNA-binding response OmpR family regulator